MWLITLGFLMVVVHKELLQQRAPSCRMQCRLVEYCSPSGKLVLTLSPLYSNPPPPQDFNSSQWFSFSMQQAVNTIELLECKIIRFFRVLHKQQLVLLVFFMRCNGGGGEPQLKRWNGARGKKINLKFTQTLLELYYKHCVCVGGCARAKNSRMWLVLPFLGLTDFSFLFIFYGTMWVSLQPLQWLYAVCNSVHPTKLGRASASFVWGLPENAKTDEKWIRCIGSRCWDASRCPMMLCLSIGRFCTSRKPQTLA